MGSCLLYSFILLRMTYERYLMASWCIAFIKQLMQYEGMQRCGIVREGVGG